MTTTTKKTTRKTAPKTKGTTAKKAAATPKKTAAKPTRTTKPATEPKAGTPVTISHEERWRMIAVSAYHKAEKRSFLPGHEVDDWLAAEREISAVLSGK